MKTNQRYEWLDGLRAIAVSLVLVGHAKLAFQFELGRIGDSFLRALNGHLGVQIFFVISGFIITLLLLREKEANGTISLGAFWRRRSFRILPALWIFLLVVAGLQILGVFTITPATWFASFLFLRNHVGEGWFTGHLWSLAVEAQFYLLWPILVARWSTSWLLRACFSGIFLAIAFRFLAALLGWQELAATSLPGNLDLLMLGALCAIYVSRPTSGALFRAFGQFDHTLQKRTAWTVLAATALVSSLLVSTRWSALAMIVEPMLVGATIAMLIVHMHGTPKGFARRILSYGPFALLGMWSYSLYLWQQLFLVHHDVWQNAWIHEHPVVWPFALVALTLASYYLIEKPFNRRGHRRADMLKGYGQSPCKGAPAAADI